MDINRWKWQDELTVSNTAVMQWLCYQVSQQTLKPHGTDRVSTWQATFTQNSCILVKLFWDHTTASHHKHINLTAICQWTCVHFQVNVKNIKKHTNLLFVELTFYSIFLWNYVRLRLSRSKKTFRQNLCGIIVTVSSCPNNSIKTHWKALILTMKNQLVLFYSPTVVTPDWKDATPIILALSYIDK